MGDGVLAFWLGVLVGCAIGVIGIGLLAGPRMAEMEHTINGLREHIRYLQGIG